MIVVAVVGQLMGGSIGVLRLQRRHDDFVARARLYAQREASFKASEITTRTTYARLAAAIEKIEETTEAQRLRLLKAKAEKLYGVAETLSQRTAYFGSLARKYHHAARYPWLRVDPDPDPP
jgi:hypothetical protein